MSNEQTEQSNKPATQEQEAKTQHFTPDFTPIEALELYNRTESILQNVTVGVKADIWREFARYLLKRYFRICSKNTPFPDGSLTAIIWRAITNPHQKIRG